MKNGGTIHSPKERTDYKMKKTLLPALCILLCTLFISVIPTEADAAIYEDTVRLHILAASDSAEDQNLKIYIRDKILEKYSYLIKDAKSSQDAKEELEQVLQNIKKDCEVWLSDAGSSHTVEVTLSDEWYNTREYKNFTLPAGIYSSLKITLEKGEGQNWWCVMYPPLCLEAAIDEGLLDSFSDEEYTLISKSGYNVKFKLLEVTSAIFKKRK